MTVLNAAPPARGSWGLGLPPFPRRSSRCAYWHASGAPGHGALVPGLPSSLRSLRSLHSSVQAGGPMTGLPPLLSPGREAP
jgi:hypothetical protein